jgi:hypothetical protein
MANCRTLTVAQIAHAARPPPFLLESGEAALWPDGKNRPGLGPTREDTALSSDRDVLYAIAARAAASSEPSESPATSGCLHNPTRYKRQAHPQVVSGRRLAAASANCPAQRPVAKLARRRLVARAEGPKPAG